MTDATSCLGEYASNIRWTDLPSKTIAAAKRCLLDSVACMLGGSTTYLGKRVASLVLGWGSRPECTVVGNSEKAILPLAAYVNGFLANVCDYDDNYFFFGHPGAGIVPVALGLGERGTVSGRELLTAIVAGYEVGIRLGIATAPSRERRSLVRGMSTWLIIGGTAAGGRLLNLSPDQMANAFGLAAQNAPVPFLKKLGGGHVRPLSELKNNFGWACMGAVMALELAQLGFCGPLRILDGEEGFWRMAGSDQCRWDQMARGLGTQFEIENVSLKAYPSCLGTHASIEALIKIIRELRVDGSHVARVEVRGGRSLSRFNDYRPQTSTDAMFSIPYALSLTLLGIRPGPRWWGEYTHKDPEVLSMASKVELLPDSRIEDTEADKRHVEVTVYTTDGRTGTATATQPLPPGDPGLGQTDLENKFIQLAAPVLGDRMATEVLGLMLDVENLSDVSPVARMLGAVLS